MGPFTFGLTAQLDPNAVRVLAFRHIQGIFSLVATQDPRAPKQPRSSPGMSSASSPVTRIVTGATPQLLEVVKRVDGYERVADFTTADGFFRASLRPGPDGAPWFWALEWNQSLRVIGWIGDSKEPPDPFQNLPGLTWHQLDANTRIRYEVPLPDDAEDLLFTPVGD